MRFSTVFLESARAALNYRLIDILYIIIYIYILCICISGISIKSIQKYAKRLGPSQKHVLWVVGVCRQPF